MTQAPRILLVDDQAEMVQLLKMIFEKSGFEAHGVYDGTSALECVENVQPDIIILDVMMPDINGFDVLRTLRANPNLPRIPVIMLSAKSEVADKLMGFEAGADDYVAKPVSPKELLARVNALLQRTQNMAPP